MTIILIFIKAKYNMALGRKFQGCKTLSIHPAQSFQWGNRLREVQWGAWSHRAGHSWPSLAHSEVTLLLCSPLRCVVKFFSFPLVPPPRSLYSYGGEPERPLREDFNMPIPFLCLCFRHGTLLLWVGSKIKVSEIGQVRWSHQFRNGPSLGTEKSRPGSELAWPA